MMDRDKAKELIVKGKDLVEKYKETNSYKFKENTLDYFSLNESTLEIGNDYEELLKYYKKFDEALNLLINELKQFNDSKKLSQKLYNRLVETQNRININFDEIKNKRPIDFIDYLNKIIKPIVKIYGDYFETFKLYIEQKNETTVKIVSMFNDFLEKVGIYTISCKEGDSWDDRTFDPEKYVSDNITDDKTKVDCIHHFYRYTYAIHVKNQEEPCILQKGKVSIWKLGG